jgi:hypothetical protein
MVVHFNLSAVDGFMTSMNNQNDSELSSDQLINGINELTYKFTNEARINPFPDVTPDDLVRFDTIGDGHEPFNNVRIQRILENIFTGFENICIEFNVQVPIRAKYFESTFYYNYDGPYKIKPIHILEDEGIDVLSGSEEEIRIAEFLMEPDNIDNSIVFRIIDDSNKYAPPITNIYLFNKANFTLIPQTDATQEIIPSQLLTTSLEYACDEATNLPGSITRPLEPFYNFGNILNRRFLVYKPNLDNLITRDGNIMDGNIFIDILKDENNPTLPSIISHDVWFHHGSMLAGHHCNSGGEPEQVWFAVFAKNNSYLLHDDNGPVIGGRVIYNRRRIRGKKSRKCKKSIKCKKSRKCRKSRKSMKRSFYGM